MSASVLVHGRLWRKPERKISKAGKPFASATLGEGDGAIWWKVVCFSESGIDELLSLGDGDGVAVSGDFKVEAYEHGDIQRLNYTVFASRVLSARRPKRTQGREQPLVRRHRPGRHLARAHHHARGGARHNQDAHF